MITTTIQHKHVAVRHLGLVDYQVAREEQERLFADTVSRKIANRARSAHEQLPTPNYLLFCEHPHVYTLGKSGDESHLLANDDFLKQISATYHRTNRGGDITYHGPGQLVGYPILDLDNFFTDIHRYMRLLEEAIILTLSDFGIVAGRIPGLTGVWLYDDQGGTASRQRKICAMGVRASRWVTMHGFALNVTTDLTYFSHIVPCGIADKAVTSMQQELGHAVSMPDVTHCVQKHLFDLFEMN